MPDARSRPGAARRRSRRSSARSPRTRSCTSHRGTGAPRPPASVRASRSFEATYHRPMSDGFDLSGKVVWVTGSSRGIGRGVAEHLARAGARVVVHARTPEALLEVTAAVEEIGAEVLAVTGDVRSEEDLATAVAAIARALRPARRDRGRCRRRGARAAGRARARAVPAPARPQPHVGVRNRSRRLPAAARGRGSGRARSRPPRRRARRRSSAPTARQRPASST